MASNSEKRIDQLVKTMKTFETMLAQARSEDPTNSAAAAGSKVTLDLIHQLFVMFKDQVMADISELRARLTSQDDHLDRLETYSRRNCVLVHGIPEAGAQSEEQCLMAACNLFSTKLQVATDPTSLDRAHRLGPPRSGPQTRPRPVIVKFKSYFDKRAVYTNKSKLKGQPELITESLTKTRHGIFNKARDHFSSRRVWTSDGKVIVKIEGAENLKVLATHRELEALIAAHPTPHPDALRYRERQQEFRNINSRRGAGNSGTTEAAVIT
uniref:Uncharacterized protein n=1 Tax=Cacopsylla melanoneura TaxID=428564 RepID=A0A8D8QWG2_9HEMI